MESFESRPGSASRFDFGLRFAQGFAFAAFFCGASVVSIFILIRSLTSSSYGPVHARRTLRKSLGLLRATLEFLGILTTRFSSDTARFPSPGVYIANHQSMLDALLLLPLLPDAVCVFKGSLGGNGLWRPIIAACGFISNSEQTSFVRQCSEVIASGTSILIFPEGTRSRRGRGGAGASRGWSFKRGFAMVSVSNAVPVVPVFLRWEKPVFGNEGKRLELAREPGVLSVSVGAPLSPPGQYVNRWLAARELTRRLEALYDARLGDGEEEPSSAPVGLGARSEIIGGFQ